MNLLPADAALRTKRIGVAFFFGLASMLASLEASSQSSAPAYAPQPALRPVAVASGLEVPWGLAFLPDGRFLVTERPGRMRAAAPNGLLGPPITGLPRIEARQQCGLLDVALDPGFAQNRWVYWSYAEPAASAPGAGGDASGNSVAVARGRLNAEATALSDVQVIFRQAPKFNSGLHCGSRLVFGRDGLLYVGLGDRFFRRADAQTLDNHHGKVVRIAPDGSVPRDNPFAGRAGALAEIWSIGHRNIQAMALNPATGALWLAEHGPQGGDEVNLVEPGKNYGWPAVTYGVEYVSGNRIGETHAQTQRTDVTPPLYYWVPTSIAPTGMAFVPSNGPVADRYPEWRGDLLVSAQRGPALLHLKLNATRVVNETRLLGDLGDSIRDLRIGPDGFIYALSEGTGRVLRLER
jgi:glucose/arabinose dehydrogenase